jgi:hypothetical protein
VKDGRLLSFGNEIDCTVRADDVSSTVWELYWRDVIFDLYTTVSEQSKGFIP